MKYAYKLTVSRKARIESALETIRWNGWKVLTSKSPLKFVTWNLLKAINPFYNKYL